MIKSEVTKKRIKNGKVEAHATVEVNGGFQDIKTELMGILNCIREECPELLIEAMTEEMKSIQENIGGV